MAWTANRMNRSWTSGTAGPSSFAIASPTGTMAQKAIIREMPSIGRSVIIGKA